MNIDIKQNAALIAGLCVVHHHKYAFPMTHWSHRIELFPQTEAPTSVTCMDNL